MAPVYEIRTYTAAGVLKHRTTRVDGPISSTISVNKPGLIIANLDSDNPILAEIGRAHV
jgi:hypothetical protein